MLGQGEYALEEARVLLPVAQSVTLLTDGSEAPADLPDGLRVETRKVSAIEGDELVSRVAFAEGESAARFRRVYRLWYGRQRRFCPQAGRAAGRHAHQGERPTARRLCRPFAAGDCTAGLLQVAKAVADGAEAAMSAVKFVRK